MTDDNPTVLVVDDDHDVADAYDFWLSERYDVRTAGDGEEALEAVCESIDAVLLDRRMPTLSGDEALVELRDRGCDVPVAMVSAVDPSYDEADLPCDAYLTKPVTRIELLEAVEALLAVDEPPAQASDGPSSDEADAR
jgi:DNA-binding response OmpR family regulator